MTWLFQLNLCHFVNFWLPLTATECLHLTFNFSDLCSTVVNFYFFSFDHSSSNKFFQYRKFRTCARSDNFILFYIFIFFHILIHTFYGNVISWLHNFVLEPGWSFCHQRKLPFHFIGILLIIKDLSSNSICSSFFIMWDICRTIRYRRYIFKTILSLTAEACYSVLIHILWLSWNGENRLNY